VTATVAVGNSPRGLAVNSITNRIYVARSLTADVLVIDGATNAVIATVALAGAIE
jgi:YVTN family beta-propeller protein